MAKYDDTIARKIMEEGLVSSSTIRTWKNRGHIPDVWLVPQVKARVIFEKLPKKTREYYTQSLPKDKLSEYLDRLVPHDMDPEILRKRIVTFKHRVIS